MDLREYLDKMGKPLRWLSAETGLGVATLDRIARKEAIRPRVDTVGYIVRASRENPTPDGETLSYTDFDIGV